MQTLVSIALRNVLRNRRRTLITLGALIMGLAAVGTIRGVLNGLQDTVTRGSIDGMVGAIQVHRTGYLANVLSTPLSMDFALDDALLAKIQAVQGVKAIAPRIQFAGSLTLAATDENDTPEALFFSATALDPVLETKVCPERSKLFTEGTTFDAEHVVLGASILSAFNAAPNAEAVLLAPDRDGSLNGELARVGGGLRAIMPGEMKVAVVPLQLAQRLLRMEGRVTELAIAVDDLEKAPQVVNAIQAAVGPEFEVHTWDSVLPERKTMMDRQNAISALISSVFLLLMLLGVANTMLMSVLERTREVGTMLAVGLTRRSVLALFLLEALLLGGLGVVGGVCAMFAVTLSLAHQGLHFTPPQASMPLDIYPFLTARFTIGISLVAVVGAALFALYPAFRASRLRPVEALAGR